MNICFLFCFVLTEWNRFTSWLEIKPRCFQTVVLENTLESPLDSKEIKLVNPKENHPEYSLEGLMLKLKLQYFGTWCEDLTQWKRPWRWERLRAGGEGAKMMRWLDGITDSVDMSSITQLSDWITADTRLWWRKMPWFIAGHQTRNLGS